jgi:hypothetical protein
VAFPEIAKGQNRLRYKKSRNRFQGELSAPVVNRYIDLLREGGEAPPIKVDGDIIVDGNHRYAAGVLEGESPTTTPGTVAPSQAANAKQFKDVKVTETDYGNH